MPARSSPSRSMRERFCSGGFGMSQRWYRVWYRHVAHLLMLAFLFASFPAAPLLAAPAALAASDPLEPAPPTVLTVPPVSDPHLPSLSLDLAVAPSPIA